MSRALWLGYAALFTIVGIPLMWLGSQDNWTGTYWSALSVLAWGGQAILFAVSFALTLMFPLIRFVPEIGDIVFVVSASVAFFAYGSLQFLVLTGLYKVGRLLVPRLRPVAAAPVDSSQPPGA